MAALTAPGMVNRLQLPHSFWVAGGMAFLLTMVLGYLPALPAAWRHRLPVSLRR